MDRDLKVYVAGPYSGGDVEANVERAIDAATRLLDVGCAPYVPHLTHFWHARHARPYEVWLSLDLEWLRACDCLLRLEGESPGADAEVREAVWRRIPVFRCVEDVVAYQDLLGGWVVRGSPRFLP